MRLEIGAGRRPTPGYQHLDIDPGPDIEIVADARSIPLNDDTCEEIYSHWVLEHFASGEIVAVLKEWQRVLIPGGSMMAVVNNQEAINRCLAEGEIGWDEWNYLTFGEHTETLAGCHKMGFTLDSLGNTLSQAGFDKIEIAATWRCKETDKTLKCPGLIALARKPQT